MRSWTLTGSPSRLFRRLLHVLIVVYVALMAATFLATGGGGPTWTGGFSSAGWGGPAYGEPQFNQTYYDYGFFGTSAPSGLIEDICSGVGNPRFGTAASYVDQADGSVWGFHFLVSYYDAVSSSVGFCNPSPVPPGPYAWGVQQADYAIATLAGARYIGYTGPVNQVVADIELIEQGTTQCGAGALRNAGTLQDSTGWMCDSIYNNRQVATGFVDRIAEACGSYCLSIPDCDFCTGVYSSFGHWQQIMGSGAYVNTNDIWIALYTNSASSLQSTAASFYASGFTDFVSWQYAHDPYCGTTYSNARNMLQNLYNTASYLYISVFDKYTNSDPSWICTSTGSQ